MTFQSDPPNEASHWNVSFRSFLGNRNVWPCVSSGICTYSWVLLSNSLPTPYGGCRQDRNQDFKHKLPNLADTLSLNSRLIYLTSYSTSILGCNGGETFKMTPITFTLSYSPTSPVTPLMVMFLYFKKKNYLT